MKVSCEYCDIFRKSYDRQWINGSGKTYKQQRFCDKINDYVYSISKACDNFILSRYFWCKKDHNWILVEGCLSRQENRRQGCTRCKQGKLIKKLWEEYNGR